MKTTLPEKEILRRRDGIRVEMQEIARDLSSINPKLELHTRLLARWEALNIELKALGELL